MICKNCGHELNDGALFCDKCGTRVEEVNEEINTPVVSKPSVDYVAIAKTVLGNILETGYDFICNPYQAALKALESTHKTGWQLLVVSLVLMTLILSFTLRSVFTVEGECVLDYLDISFGAVFLNHFLILVIVTGLTFGILYLVFNLFLKKGLKVHQLLNFIAVTSLPLTVAVMIGWILGYVSTWLLMIVLLIGVLAYFGLIHEVIRTIEGAHTKGYLCYMGTSLALTIATLVTFYFMYRLMLEDIVESLLYFLM